MSARPDLEFWAKQDPNPSELPSDYAADALAKSLACYALDLEKRDSEREVESVRLREALRSIRDDDYNPDMTREIAHAALNERSEGA